MRIKVMLSVFLSLGYCCHAQAQKVDEISQKIRESAAATDVDILDKSLLRSDLEALADLDTEITDSFFNDCTIAEALNFNSNRIKHVFCNFGQKLTNIERSFLVVSEPQRLIMQSAEELKKMEGSAVEVNPAIGRSNKDEYSLFSGDFDQFVSSDTGDKQIFYESNNAVLPTRALSMDWQAAGGIGFSF